MRRVRVLEIISGFAIEGPLGGIERFGIELARALPAVGVEPVVCGMWDYGTAGDRRWLDVLQAEGIEAFKGALWEGDSPYRAFMASWNGTKRALAGQQVDVIHSHCQFGDALALLMQRPLRAKAVIRTVHNEREWMKRPERRLLFTNFLAPLLMRRELGVSRQVVANLNRRPVARLLQKSAILAYNAVNLARFQTPVEPSRLAARQAALGVPPDALVVGSIGRLEPQKGYAFLLDAMTTVVQQLPQAHLLLVGDGSLAEELQVQAQRSPVADHLHLVGPQAEIEEIYGMMRLFVSSSLWEGLPTVILESLAAGVPVVATQVSGSSELVVEGKSGRLVAPGNVGALAEAIVAMLRDDAMRERMASSAQVGLEPFDIQRIAQVHAELYHGLQG